MRLLDLLPFARRAGAARWPRIVWGFVGLIALSAAIWYGGQMAGIAPFDAVATRIWIISAIWILALAIWIFRIWRRRRAARRIEEALAPAASEGDGRVRTVWACCARASSPSRIISSTGKASKTPLIGCFGRLFLSSSRKDFQLAPSAWASLSWLV